MSEVTTVTTKGQVTIPYPVRQMLGIKIGDKVYFNQLMPKKRQAVMQLVPKDVIDQLYGSLASGIKYSDLKTVRKKAKMLLAKKYGLNE